MFPMDPFIKAFLNRYNIASGQLHPNSYSILTDFIELVHKESREPDLEMFWYMYSLTKKNGELTFSLSVVLNYRLFVKLLNLNKACRHTFFIIEHPMDFSMSGKIG